MKTVLITGAHGFIGRNCARYFSRNGCRVIGIGHGTWKGAELKEAGIESWVEASITFEALDAIDGHIATIIHCAGSGSVAYSLAEPMLDFQRTVDSTLAVLEFIRRSANPINLVYPSSAAVYGLNNSLPTKENSTTAPISPYGVHKKIAEELCVSYASSFGVETAIIRFFSIYGAGLKKQLLWDACRKISGTVDDNVCFFGSGNETRDWLHVDDAAALILAVSEQKMEPLSIINGGTGVSTPVRDILQTIADAFGNNSRIQFNGEVRTGDPMYYEADISLATRLGWSPRVHVKAGIREYVEWFRNLALP